MSQKDSEIRATRRSLDSEGVRICRADMAQAGVPRDSVFKVLRLAKSRSASLWRCLGQAVVVLLAGLCFHMPAFASCNFTSGSRLGTSTVSLPDSLSVPRSASVGSIIYDSGTVKSVSPVSFSCGTSGSKSLGYASARSLVPGYTDVYQTGVAGIGIKVMWGNWQSDSIPWTSSNVQIAASPRNTTSYPSGTAGPMGQFRLQLIVTGPVGSGTLNLPGSLVTASYDATTIDQLNLNNGNASVQSATCTVTKAIVPVPMLAAKVKDLPSVGSTTGNQSFSLDLNCNPEVALYVTLSDVSTPSNRSSTLSLSSGSTAKGIAYQIAYSGSPVAFGADSAAAGNINQFSVSSGKTVGGPVSVPFSASYVRTGTVVPGTANAKATFTMSYQ